MKQERCLLHNGKAAHENKLHRLIKQQQGQKMRKFNGFRICRSSEFSWQVWITYHSGQADMLFQPAPHLFSAPLLFSTESYAPCLSTYNNYQYFRKESQNSQPTNQRRFLYFWTLEACHTSIAWVAMDEQTKCCKSDHRLTKIVW